MANNLFIIEAPGKRGALFDVLRRAGVRDIDIEATVGHLASSPDGFKPLAVDASYRETAYRIRPEKEHLALRIAGKAEQAQRIYLATDDDQEGDVIARDAFVFCVPQEHRHKCVRMRLKAMSVSEVRTAMAKALPFDESAAWQGDARRVVDRLIGALSGEDGAVGRVQGSLLLAMANAKPVVGVVTHTLAAADGGAPFVARCPVFAGDPVPDPLEISRPVFVGPEVRSPMSVGPMNHDHILLAASLETGAKLIDVSRAMQSQYEKGRMSYPRAKDSAVTPEAVRRITMLAQANGAVFQSRLFTAVRQDGGIHTHEAPNPLVLDVSVNRPLELQSLDEQVLIVIARNLIDCGVEGRMSRPDPASLPPEARDLNWMRLQAVGSRLWASAQPMAGVQKWTQEQSLLHFAAKNGLGRPSTIVPHIEKFLTRGLVTQAFDLTDKGKDWAVNVAGKIGHRNLSVEIENYLDSNRKPSHEMVTAMVESFGLNNVAALVQSADQELEHDAEVSTGLVFGD